MNVQDLIDQLDAMEAGDNEQIHLDADKALLDALRNIGGIYGAVAAAYERCRRRVGFWYA